MRGWKASLQSGAWLGLTTLAVETLAIFPGRYTSGRLASQLGQSIAETTVAGIFRDLSDILRPFGLALGVVLAVALFLRAKRPLRILFIALGVAGFILWFTSSATAEFKVQRGVDATWLDVQIASHATGRSSTIAGFLGCRRHWLPGLISLGALAPLVVFLRRRARQWELGNRFAVLGGFAGVTLLSSLLALAPLDPHLWMFSTIADRHAVGEPFVNILAGFGRSQENVRLGMRGLIETTTFPPSTGGEALLGLPHVERRTDADCSVHPFARSFTEDGVEPERLGATGHHPVDADTQAVLVLLDQLSAALYENRKQPIDVMQIMLESFRADDVHGITPSAPRALTPFVNSLYEADNVVGFKNMWQAGSRSSQGFSSYMCGLGTMPYGLSTTRDFGALPLRCLTDVIADAQFDTAFWYGGNPSFDEMDPFLRRHGVRDITGHQQFPADAPVGQEGVTDRYVFADAASHLLPKPVDRARYTLLFSASNHVPFMRPGDVPAEVDAQVDALAHDPAFIGGKEEIPRLRTFAYADEALGELYAKMKPRHDRTLFVLGADHATSDPWAWETPNRDKQAGLARIPFAIVFPEPLIAASAHPDDVRGLVHALNDAVNGRAWSQNDTPLFVLTLIGHAPGMRALPRSKRWHTLGGERTSPYFSPLHGAKAQGIDAMSGLFGEDDEGHSLLPAEKAAFVTKPEELFTSSPSLTPVAASMGDFLRDYVVPCTKLYRSRKHAPVPAGDPSAITVLGEEEAP